MFGGNGVASSCRVSPQYIKCCILAVLMVALRGFQNGGVGTVRIHQVSGCLQSLSELIGVGDGEIAQHAVCIAEID
ncbi:putative regulator of cell autolysis [Zymobacter palmae]|uniref:Putative regulator of cell autolysis n=1 Tax=Zymobacter palmae TaxID=33074 RepID=A0A348HDR8_9GAMM|nr:putative regulator of cell autolysis [Zymobacter palmae]